MTPVAEMQCSDCGADLAITYEESPIGENCKHRMMREVAREEVPCPMCVQTHKRILEKCLAAPPICAQCAEKDEQEEQLRRELEAEQKRIQLSRIPTNLQRLRWGELIISGDRAVAIAAASKWAEAPSAEAKGIYLWGEVGTGKTRLAATAAWSRLVEHHQPLRWVSVAVLLTRMEASFSDKERQNALEVLTGETSLVLDDIDKVTPTEAKRAQLYTAIDRRIVAKVPLLVTGNLSPSQLEDKLGDAIASRLLGYALGRTFEMDGPDRRMTLDVGQGDG